MKECKEDIPPNSRLFVLHGKNTTREELQEAFEKYGTVEDIWMVRDRETHELKGVSYVKFTKMSEAALAMENMNGVALASNPRPLKVIIANSREEGSRKDDDIDRFLRLFIVVSKDDTDTEQSLRDYFSIFGEVESVNILRNRETNESKGFAYIKFNKVYSTAKALEECEPKYRAVLAKPKEKRDSVGASKDIRPPKFNSAPASSRYGDLFEGYAADHGFTKISAFISTQLTEELAARLFDLIPGLIFARLTDDVVSHRTQKMILEYETPEAAAFAVDRLSGFEYPIGEPVMLKPEFGWNKGIGQSFHSSKPMYNERKRDYMGNQTRSTGFVSKYCTAKLPPVKPVAKEEEGKFRVKDEEGKFRLFVVCQPEAPPLSSLRDVFCRFGNFVNIFILPGKNYGYAFYTNEESAQRAIEVLHGEELHGNRLKVMEAEPRVESKKQRHE